jgi:hypothetical protein
MDLINKISVALNKEGVLLKKVRYSKHFEKKPTKLFSYKSINYRINTLSKTNSLIDDEISATIRYILNRKENMNEN